MIGVGLLLLSVVAVADDARRAAETQAREMLAEIIPIDTSTAGPRDGTRQVAGRLAARLIDAGLPREDVQVLGPDPRDGNLIARFRSPDPQRPPVLLLVHLDVVQAQPSEWATDPWQLVEKDGWWYGRGTRDLKNGAANLVTNFIRLKQEGFRPARDLIMIGTADEETTGAGIQWLLKEHRVLVDAAFALNQDAGYVELKPGGPAAFHVQTAEKTYATYRLEARGPGGHSRAPTPDNPLYALARTLEKVRQLRFPIELNDTTRNYFAKAAPMLPETLAHGAIALGAGRLDDPAVAVVEAAPYYNSLLRTTCVATQTRAGDSENSLPQVARATVNCRILPQADPEAVTDRLRDMAAPDGVTVTVTWPPIVGPPSPLTPEVLQPVAAVASELWPGSVVIPEMESGATDGLYLRAAGIPTYGVGAVAESAGDDRSHAANERISIEAFNLALEYWYRLLKRL